MINHFTDLNCWKEAHNLVLLVYKLTSEFPEPEKFALTNQLRRAVVSITSNIAEGFARNSDKDKIHFYSMARGSLFEIESQLYIARDLHYIESSDFGVIQEKITLVSKLISGVIKSAPSK